MSVRMSAHNLRKQADLLDKCTYTMIITYMQQTGMSKEEITAILEGEDGEGSWFTADEVVDYGFADGYIPDNSDKALGAVACIGRDMYAWNGHEYDLSIYGNAPTLVSERRNFEMSNVNGSAPAAQANSSGVNTPETPIAQEIPAVPVAPIAATPVPVTEASAASAADIGAAVQTALQADRERISRIENLKQIHPAQAAIIDKAKIDGLSYEATAAAVLDAEVAAKAAGAASEGGAAAAVVAGIVIAGAVTAQVGAAPAPPEGASKQDEAAASIAASWKK
jgi:hypothetical protein